MHDLKNIEEAKKHGLVELKGTEIVGFEEKPLNPKTTLASICCYKFNNETKPLLEQYLKEGHKDNTGNFIKYLIGKQKINAFLFKEKVYDIGSMQSYEMVCKKMAK